MAKKLFYFTLGILLVVLVAATTYQTIILAPGTNMTFTTNNDTVTIAAATLTDGTGITNLSAANNPALQASNMRLSNEVGLASTVFTNVPLGGTNIGVRTAGGTNFIDTIGQLNNWSQISTGALANAGSNLVVVLAGTSTTVALTSTNGTNFYAVSSTASGGGGISTNSGQFGANPILTIASGVLLTNAQHDGQMLLTSTNYAGASNVNALTISNSFPLAVGSTAGSNSQFAAGIALVGAVQQTGANGGNPAHPVMEILNIPTINASNTAAASTLVIQSRSGTNGVATTNLTVTSAGTATFSGATIAPFTLTAAGDIQAGTGFNFITSSGTFKALNNSALTLSIEGAIKLSDSTLANFRLLQFGNTTAAFPGIGRTNGHLIAMGADGLFAGGTNGLIVMGNLLTRSTATISTNTALHTTIAPANLHNIAIGKGWTNDLGARADIIIELSQSDAATGDPGLAFTNSATGEAWTNSISGGLVQTRQGLIYVLDVSTNDYGSFTDISTGSGSAQSFKQAWWKLK